MLININFKNGVEFSFPRIKSYKEEKGYLKIVLSNGYKREWSLDNIESYEVKEYDNDKKKS